MSEQDVSMMRDAYAAFNRGDIPAVLEVFDAQIEWREPGGGRAPRGTFNGPESVGSDVFAAVPEHFDEFAAEPEEFIDAGESVAVVGSFRGKAKSGRQLQARFVHAWRLRDGKLVSFENLVEAAPWAEAWSVD
jgi:ketosteroid isomerase-like protein